MPKAFGGNPVGLGFSFLAPWLRRGAERPGSDIATRRRSEMEEAPAIGADDDIRASFELAKQAHSEEPGAEVVEFLATDDVPASAKAAAAEAPGVEHRDGGASSELANFVASGATGVATGAEELLEKASDAVEDYNRVSDAVEECKPMSEAGEESAGPNNEGTEQVRKKRACFSSSPTSLVQGFGQGEAMKGMKVKKKFGRRYYDGEVMSYDRENRWYKIVYEDGDEEELWWEELEPILVVSGSLPRSSKRSRSGSGGRQTRSKKKQLLDPDEQEQNVGEVIANRSSIKRSSRKISPTASETMARRDEENESVGKTRHDLGSDLVGSKMRKHFRDRLYKGEVIGYDPDLKYYKVLYDDGEEEELEWKELKPMIEATEQAYSPTKKLLAVEEPCTIPDRCEPKLDNCNAVPRKFQHHPALKLARFSFASDTENVEFHAWGEVVSYDKLKCPDLQAANVLPTSSPIVHLAASHHHLAAITASGHVWLWRTKHGNISERCNQWEHISDLDNKAIVLVDVAGPDLDRPLSGYAANQEDQVPDPFYLAAISCSGEDYVFQGSLPQEPVRTYSDPRFVGLKALLKLNGASIHDVGRVVQVSVGCVQAPDEPPFIGYITDTGRIYIRSATKDFMEEVNHVTGFSGKPLKIQCGRAYHAIFMTDDGRAWTWGIVPLSNCQAALGTLVGRKVIDVGCHRDDFVALTDDGNVHFWTHGTASPATGTYSVPTMSENQIVPPSDKLRAVTLGYGACAGISSNGKVHTWRTPAAASALNCCFQLTPLERDVSSGDTVVGALVSRDACKVLCTPSSLIIASRRRPRGRPGTKMKDGSTIDEEPDVS